MSANIIDCLMDHDLWRPWIRNPATFKAWFAYLKACYCLEMDEEEFAIYRACTDRQNVPTEEVTRSALICGRRSGKSLVMSLVATFLATMRDYTEFRVGGETLAILVMSKDRAQSAVVLSYIKSMFLDVPLLAPLVQSVENDCITLTSGIEIVVTTANFRSARGKTVIAAILDEVAWWVDGEGSANPATEVILAIEPALATTAGKLLMISSPYSKSGVLFSFWQKHHGIEGDPALSWVAPTRRMNETVPQEVIDAALADDPEAARAEWLAEWRSDLQSLLTPEAVDACVVPGRYELPRMSAAASYVCFLDSAGGSGKDSFAAAIAHQGADGVGVLDCLFEARPPFNADAVVADIAAVCARFGVNKATSDKWGGNFVIESFARNNITVEPSARSKAELYQDFLPLISSGRVELLDIARLRSQLLSLQRRTRTGGRSQIDAPNGQPEDCANVVAGALVAVAGSLDWIQIWHKLAS